MEGTDTENSIPWDGGGLSCNKKKKGRRKFFLEEFQGLPEHAIIEKDEQAVIELQAAYRILQSINMIKHISPFREEPRPDKFGMSSYFSVIKKPMWLNKVQQKIESGEYEGLHDFVEDLHLILYNCYKFWGHTHRISFRGYIIEHKLEAKLSELPWSLREKIKCPVSTGDCIICDITANNSQTNERSNELDDESISDPSIVRYNSKGYTSKIVIKVLEEDEEEIEPEEESSEAKEERLQMEKWESSTLNGMEGATDLKNTAELAEIGLFLKLTYEVLNVEEMTQYEVERMLLIPLESATLQTIMTSTLSPEWKRTTLDETPLMPYAVWNSKLRQRITSWYQVFYRYCDVVEAFTHIGIDPYFWSVTGLLNPMDDNVHFHELSFYIRVWIFKSLLDNLLHTNKTLQDVLLDEKTETDSLRHLYIGQGHNNNHYKAIPHFLPEIRVYRELKPLMSTWANWMSDFDAESHLKLQRNRMTFNQDTLSWGPNRKAFEIVADNLDSLNSLIEFAESNSFSVLRKSLMSYKTKAVSHIHCEGLKSVYTQYHDFHARPCEYFTNMENLWLSYTTKPLKEEKQEVSQDNILGKRKITPNKLIYLTGQGLSNSSSETEEEQAESDVSDWESSYKNHQRKKKLKSSKQLSKLLDPAPTKPVVETTAVENGKLDKEADDLLVKQEPVLFSEFKMEPVEVTSSVQAEDNVSSTTDIDFTDNEKGFGLNIAATLSIGEVKEEDTVVVLSSDDEQEVKPTINKIKLRDVNTLLESPPPTTFQPEVSPQPVERSPILSPNLTANCLNVVIPINAMNQVITQRPPEPTMSLQVPPNLFRMSQPRQRAPISRPVMQVRQPVRQNIRQPIRPIAPQGILPNSQRMKAPAPKSVTPKKPVPRPIPMSPQEWARTPTPVSPGVQPASSPRGRSPATPPQQRMWANNSASPRNRSPMTPPSVRGNAAAGRTSTMPPRSLFDGANSDSAEGKVTMGLNESGTGYGFQIVLPDGGVRYLTDAEVNAIKRRNSGTLPRTLRIPADGSFS